MTEDELVEFIGGLADVEVVVAGPDNGAPEAAWGDVFFTVAGRRMPFATIVKRDQPGDQSSRLDRDGVFRVNIGIGRAALKERFAAEDMEAIDPAALDRFFPHPVYGGHGFVGVLNPDTTADEVRELVVAAHAREH